MLRPMSEWRRFERSSRGGDQDQYWAVRVVDRVVEMRRGWADYPPGQVPGEDEEDHEQRSYARASGARSAAQQKIRSRLGRGWVEVEDEASKRAPRPTLPGAEALELAIAQDPTQLDNWAVYADFLQEREPLVGERLGLGLALARAESPAQRSSLEAKIAQFERAHARELLGVSLASSDISGGLTGVVEFERRLGMIVGATLHEPRSDIVKFDTLVRALLNSPVARLLLELRIIVQVETLAYGRIVDMLATRRHPALRELVLGDPRSYVKTTAQRLPSLQTLLDTMPSLERLELHGPLTGAISHPRLRELKLGWPVRSPRLKPWTWRLPALETLHLYEPGLFSWARVEFPRLETLLVAQSDEGDELIKRLARAPLLAQLDSLVLDRSDLSDTGIGSMLAHAKAFAQVPRIVVLNPADSGEARERLAARLPNVMIRRDPYDFPDEDLADYQQQRSLRLAADDEFRRF